MKWPDCCLCSPQFCWWYISDVFTVIGKPSSFPPDKVHGTGIVRLADEIATTVSKLDCSQTERYTQTEFGAVPLLQHDNTMTPKSSIAPLVHTQTGLWRALRFGTDILYAQAYLLGDESRLRFMYTSVVVGNRKKVGVELNQVK